jgi:hypothetical protein
MGVSTTTVRKWLATAAAVPTRSRCAGPWSNVSPLNTERLPTPYAKPPSRRSSGNVKANLGFRRFSRRGLDTTSSEWRLICAAHNLFKIHRHQLATTQTSNPNRRAPTRYSETPALRAIYATAPTARVFRLSGLLANLLSEASIARPSLAASRTDGHCLHLGSPTVSTSDGLVLIFTRLDTSRGGSRNAGEGRSLGLLALTSTTARS